MSCCGETGSVFQYSDTSCFDNNIRSPRCPIVQTSLESYSLCNPKPHCPGRPDCGGFRPTGPTATGICPGRCQCAEEEVWNTNVPPKPNCEWISNFSELRRQWSDHARQQNCKCCNCKPCRTAVKCRPCRPTSCQCSTTSLHLSDCQDSFEKHRLVGGANPEAERKSTSLTVKEFPVKREAGGGCSQEEYHQGTTTNYSSSCSSWCPAVTEEAGETRMRCGSCSLPSRSILKKRDCCQCSPGYCTCQPLPRSCHCPPPVHVDVRPQGKCSCECIPSPECACDPSEKRFRRSQVVTCPNTRGCCTLARATSKCSCPKCQPCFSSLCNNCEPRKCPLGTCSEKSSCFRCGNTATLCASCSKVTSVCFDPSIDDGSSIGAHRGHHPTGASEISTETAASQTNTRNKETETNGGYGICSIFSYVEQLGYSILVPRPLTLVSFILLTLLALSLSSGLVIYSCYALPKRTCFRKS